MKSKRIWAWILSIVMVFSLLPMTQLFTAKGAVVSVKYEAEDSTVCTLTKVTSANSRVRSDLNKASGGAGACLYPENYVTFTVDVEAADTYDVTYAVAANSYPTGSTVTEIPVEFIANDGDAVTETITNNKNYNNFTEYKVSLDLVEGTNTIRFTNACIEDSTIFINLDYIAIDKEVDDSEITTPEPETEEPTVDRSTIDPSTVEAAIGKHEAEDAVAFTSGASISENANFSGGKYVGGMNFWPNNGYQYLTDYVYAEEAGDYTITVYYAGGEADHPCNVCARVNYGEWSKGIAEGVSSWNNPICSVEINVSLEAGVNIIDITGASNIYYSNMGWEWINVDYFEIAKTVEETYEGQIKKTGAALQEENLVRFRGRNLTQKSAVTFDYTGSGFEFIYEGSGTVLANITTTSTEVFAVDVDGTVTYTNFSSKTGDLVLAEDLENGTHTIKLYKTKEAMTGLAQLNYLVYDENASLSPTEIDYNFLFLGSSSSCGSQMDPDTGNQNGYLAFPSVVSRAYNATWQQISVSGRGCTQGTLGESGWAFSQDNQIAELYTYQSWFRDKTTMFDSDSFIPDVIVTNFPNDFGSTALKNGYTADEALEHMFDFFGELRTAYPNAYLVITYGNYPNYDLDGVYSNYEISAKYKAATDKYIEETGDSKVAYVQTPCLTNGQSGHPSDDEQFYISELMSAQIAEFLGVTNPLPVTHFEIEKGTLHNATSGNEINQITTWASKFSDNCYIQGMNVNLGEEEIAADGSNVKYVSVPVTVAQAGYYNVELNYATDQMPTVYMRANDGDWNKIKLSSTGDWAAVRQNTSVNVYLSKGENIIDVTGDTTGSYICLDRLDLTYVGEKKPETEEPDAPDAIGRHEAENADSFTQGSADNPASVANNENFSGGVAIGGMNTWPNNGRAYCTTKVKASESGIYNLVIAYAGGEANHPCNIDVRVNNAQWNSVLAEDTGAWNTVGTVQTQIELIEGINTIDITGACNIWYEGMGWEWINLDYFEISKVEEESTEEITTAEESSVEPVSEQTSEELSSEEISTEPTSEESSVEPSSEEPSVEPTSESPSTEPSSEVTSIEPTSEVTTPDVPEQTTVTPATQDKNAELIAQIKKGKVKVKSTAKKKSAKKLKVFLKKQLSSVSGYQVWVYKAKKNAKNNKKTLVKLTVKKNSKAFTLTHKKLKNKKVLFIRVRGFRKIANTMYYSKWSAIKKVKGKKK